MGALAKFFNPGLVLAVSAALILTACATSAPTPKATTAPETVDVENLRRYAEEAYAAREWLKAEAYLVGLTRALPETPDPWFRLGNVYARTDRLAYAVQAYHEALLRAPQHTRAWHNLGIVQLRQARTNFRKLQEHGPADDPLRLRAAQLEQGIIELLGRTRSEPAPQ